MEYTITMSSILPANIWDFLNRDFVPAGIIIIAIVLVMSSLRRRYGKPRKEQTSSQPASSQAGGPSRESVHRLRTEVESAIVELQDLSRRISSEIDTRFARLEAAIHDADRRIAVLQRLIERAEEQHPGERQSGGVVPSKRDDERLDSRHARVYEMADGGRTPVEIARELGKTPGEVELILNLRRSTG